MNYEQKQTLKLMREAVRVMPVEMRNLGYGQISKLKLMQFPELQWIVMDSLCEADSVDEVAIRESSEDFGAFCLKHQLYGIPTNRTVKLIRQEMAGYKPHEIVEIGAGNGYFCSVLGILGVDNYMQRIPEIKAHYEALGQVPLEYRNPQVIKCDAIEYLEKNPGIKVVFGSYITSIKENVFGVDENRIFQGTVEKYIHLGSSSHYGKGLLANPEYKARVVAENLLIRTGFNGTLWVIERA